MLESSAKPPPSPRERLVAGALRLMPNGLTFGAIFCGFTALRLSGDHRFGWAMAAIGAAALFDVADGFAARRLNAASAFGAELDSLGDFLNFGIAPAMVLYQRDLYRLGWSGWLNAACYVAATLIRLARFNVSSKSGHVPEGPHMFRGLPSTAAALIALLAALAASFAGPDLRAIALAAAVLVLAGLMISPMTVPSLQALHERFRPHRREGEERR